MATTAEGEGRGWAAGRLLFANPVYRLSLNGRVPKTLAVVPPDDWPGDSARGDALVNGEFAFFGVRTRVGHHEWRSLGMSPAWMAELHGFDWLRDLRSRATVPARRRARELVGDWLDTQWGWHAIAWRPDVIGRRLFAWLALHDFFCMSADDAYRERYFIGVVKQARHLDRVVTRGVRGEALIASVKGLIASGTALLGHDRWTQRGLRVLERELARQVLADGGHISRNPSVQARVLRHLIDIRGALLAAKQPVPDFLLGAIDRAVPFLRMLRHFDDALALFNGSAEEEVWFLDTLFNYAEARGQPLKSAPHSGFRRIVADRTLVLVDTGPPSRPAAGVRAHAGTLSFEVSAGKQRLIVNCGAWRDGRPPWPRVQRATAAHSTLVIDAASSSEIRKDGRLGRRPVAVDVEPEPGTGSRRVAASHDGYAPLFGLIHRRVLTLSSRGDKLVGEDTLHAAPDGGARKAEHYTIRFHLHPNVRALADGEPGTVFLRLPKGLDWRFHTLEGTVSLEESVYLGSGTSRRRSDQIVVRGAIDDPDSEGRVAHVRWALERLPRRKEATPSVVGLEPRPR